MARVHNLLHFATLYSLSWTGIISIWLEEVLLLQTRNKKREKNVKKKRGIDTILLVACIRNSEIVKSFKFWQRICIITMATVREKSVT